MQQPDHENDIFFPVQLSRRIARGRMVYNALPGFILAISVLGTSPGTVGALMLNIFCFIAGILVIFFSIREFRKPGVHRQPGTDMVAVFTGLLLIAQGALLYNAFKGFQPAHLYFASALLFIFKGVMLPDSKYGKGFLVTDKSIIFHASVFRKYTLNKFNLADISSAGNTVTFRYRNDDERKIKIKGAIHLEAVVNDLKSAVLTQQ